LKKFANGCGVQRKLFVRRRSLISPTKADSLRVRGHRLSSRDGSAPLPDRLAVQYVASVPLEIGQRLGLYEITSLMGRGGMGEVYRARDSKLKRDVAIKILPDEFSSMPALPKAVAPQFPWGLPSFRPLHTMWFSLE
jgi:serine/threonine protein kinase